MPHIMIPLHDHRDPALDRWVSHTSKLVEAFTRDVHGDDAGVEALDSFFIHTAADLVWTRSASRPCWSHLDVHEWLALLAESPTWDPDLRAHAVLTIAAFFTFLLRYDYLDGALALGVLRSIEPDVNACSQEFGWWECFSAEETVRRATSCVTLGPSCGCSN